ENSDICAATFGGMGLTGVILSARFRVRPIASSLIDETTIRAPCLETLLQQFQVYRSAPYSVAWIDCLSQGRDFGRGVLMLGEHVDAEKPLGTQEDTRSPIARRGLLSVPMELPISPLNRWTIKLFNEAYYRLHRPGRRRRYYDGFFFPLDAVGEWNRIYGRSGFVQ